MAHIDDHTVNEIKARATSDIVGIVRRYTALKQSGKDYVGLCPFHKDRNIGSFVVSPSKGVISCFSCGWHGGIVDFVMEKEHCNYVDAMQKLAKMENVYIEDNKQTVPDKAPAMKVAITSDLPLITFPIDMVRAKLAIQAEDPGPFVKWLKSLDWSQDERTTIDKWLGLYGVGVSHGGKTDGWTIWWYMDEQRRVRTGKLMAYKPDGHRDKQANPYIDKFGETKYYTTDFIHSMLEDWRMKKSGKKGWWSDKTHRAELCLFGLHLVDISPEAEVCIVESEKSALIAQIASNPQEKIWMATGSLSSLTRKRLQPLIDRNRWIVLYPDIDGIAKWRVKAKEIGYDRLIVSDRMQQLYVEGVDNPKSDIADIIVRHLTPVPEETERDKIHRLLGVQGDTKALDSLIGKLNLKLME